MRSQFVIPCLALAGLISPFAAIAAAPVTVAGYEMATRIVHFGDLDLNSQRGIAKLYSRIESAAQDVCEPPNFRSPDTTAQQRLCEKHAINDAVAGVKSSQLMSFHMSMTNQIDTALNR